MITGVSRVRQTVTIDRPVEAVFDYLADMQHLPEWMPQDFERVSQETPGPLSAGERFRYVTRGGRVESTFEWTEFDRPVRLRWHGPPVRVGPLGSVEGGGEYLLEVGDGPTRVTVAIEPRFGGVLSLFAPLTRASIRRRLAGQVQVLKQRIEAES